jgi:hypothetical protein
LTFFNLNQRTPRPPQGPPNAGYPASLRRVLYWYDGLTDWQRLQYTSVAILFLLACGGYLLGLGSAIVLARVDTEQALAAEALPTEEPSPSPTAVPVIPTAAPTLTPVPTATRVPPTPVPTQTPFSAPVIAEPPAVPRQLPAAPVVVAPVAPRSVPTTAKPRNVETAQPEAPSARVATPTPGLVRSARTVAPTAVREAASPTSRADVRATPLPTLAVPPTAVLAKPAVVATPVLTPAPTRAQPAAQATPVKTPPAR